MIALSSVILSAAKDLTPIASGDEVLRFAQDDSLPEPNRVIARSAIGTFVFPVATSSAMTAPVPGPS